MIKDVKYHVLRDFSGKDIDVDSQSTEGMSPAFRDNYIAFTCLLPVESERALYCGVTAYNGDILAGFDVESKTFRSMGYQNVAEQYEVKVHRSLELASDGTIYGASACLHEPDKRLDAPGGCIFKLAPGTRAVEKLCIPSPPDYIQTITLDEKRQLIHGFTYPVFKYFVYHIDTKEVQDFDYIGSITHISAVDDAGRLWGTWHNTGHYLFCYDPAKDAPDFTRNQLPGAQNDANRMYPGAGPVDVMINGGDGYIYIGSTGGALYRLDPNTGEAEWLGKPTAAARMPGLTVWRDGLLLGVVGDDEAPSVFVYDRQTRKFDVLGSIVAAADGKTLYRTHDVAAFGDDTIYVAETDVPDRSGYLWECKLDY